jgi:1-acyl-sn-glycerol-3-phosphate acyltransferase
MNLLKNIFARIWALWGLITFIITFAIFFLPSMIAYAFKDEKKGQVYFISMSRIWMNVWLFLIGCTVSVKRLEAF